MQLIIGNYNYSSWSMRAWLLLTHFNLPFETIRIPLDTATTDEQIARFSKAGKVPVLIDHATEIWDSLAICEYLSEHYLAGAGWPSDSLTRAQARSASAEMHSSFNALRAELPMNCRASRRVEIGPAALSDIARVEQIWTELRQRHATSGNWLFGQFSIADCMYAPLAARFNSYQPDLSSVCQDYVDSILQHPAVITWYRLAEEETEVLVSEELGPVSTNNKPALL
jgi:glutathione S-transferase